MTFVWWIAGVLGRVASIIDWRTRRIPNWLSGWGLIAGIVCGASMGWRGLGVALAGAAVGFLLLLPLHWMGAMLRGVRSIPYAPAIVVGVWVSLVGGG